MKKMFVPSLRTPLLLSALLAATQLASAATDTWNGSINADWSNAGNWSDANNAAPVAGDSLYFGFSSSTTTLNNDLAPGLAIYGITFLGAQSLTLNGSSILLSGQAYANTVGILNESGNPQTFGMNLGIDWGYYTFTGIVPNGIALNGTLTNAVGGVAYFDQDVTSTSLTADGTTGLIAGLGGAGLMYDGTSPTGLATISGGAISAYTGFATKASGAIGSGNNIELTASGAATAYTANNNTVNTITADQAGNSGGTFTDTLTTTGTLTLGQNGGIYAFNGGANKNLLTVTGGSLTAGTGAGATIVLGANGTTAGNSPPNMMTVSSIIADNAGGAVSVVKVGTGSVVVNGANTYSGGVFLLQGQVQVNLTGLGTGPLYIAQGTTAFLNGGNGTYVNDMYISPGTGSSLWSSTGANPGAVVLPTAGSGTTFFNGKLTLLGAPVPAATYPPTAGCRLTGDKDTTEIYNFQNQITGPGTLDLNASPHATQILLNNNPGIHSLNDWQGGLIIEESLLSASSARNIIVQLGFDNQIPHGASAGDVTLYTADTSAFATVVRLDLNGHNNTINGLNGSYNSHPPFVSNFGSAPSVLTIGDNNASGIFAGSTTDNTGVNNLSLVKIGSGTQTFTGALGHHGSTTVNGGTFKLSGSATLATTPLITVAAGATFDANDLGGFSVGAGQTLNCVGTVVGNNTTINGTVEALDPIGTLTDSGNLVFGSGGAYVWNINNATGTAGSDPGWSLLNSSGTLDLSSLGASSFTINVTSLDNTDTAGSAANFNPLADYSWPIAYAAGGINGFNSAQFNIVTSAFANHPDSSSQWSVSVDGTGNYLMLNYSGFAVLTTQLPATPLVVNQNDTATFTVTANSLGTGPSFAWTQNGNPLSDGGTSAGGAPGNVSIVTSGGGYTSTLTITGVDAAALADSSTISVTATETYNSSLRTGSSSQTLTVIDAPYDPNVVQTQISVPISAGAVNVLTASASGTAPFTYQWYLDGNAIDGATGSSYVINVSPATAGSYTVIVSNPAGGVTSSTTVVAPVSSVPNQILFEPFDYTDQPNTTPRPPWDAPGVTNLFDQFTGVPVTWTTTPGTLDAITLPAYYMADPNTPPGGSRDLATDEYPVAGLAGNGAAPDASIVYAVSDGSAQVNLPFGTGGAITNGPVYCSAVIHMRGFNAANGASVDYMCGFNSGADNSTTHSVGLYVECAANVSGAFPNIPYNVGIFKGNLTTGGLSPGVNGDWDANQYLNEQIIFVVFRLNINPAGGSTCDLWINPAPSTFYASEANVPASDTGAVGGGAPDTAGGVSSFFIKTTTYPVSRYYGDVRIGRTWASVTPPSAPTLSLANQVLTNPVSSTVVFASQNAGNPVDPNVGPYQWQFNGVPITSDGPSGHGPSGYSGSGTATLTITNATAADAGTYTVTGSNTDPSPAGGSATLTGSASALLTTSLPVLSISGSPSNVILSWPTNWPAALEATTSLAPPITWTAVAGGESSFLYWPPGSGSLAWAPTSPPTISGTNYTVTVAPGSSGAMFFQLAPSP